MICGKCTGLQGSRWVPRRLVSFPVHPFRIVGPIERADEQHLGVRWLATALAAPNRPSATVIRFRSLRLSAKAKAVASYRTPRRLSSLRKPLLLSMDCDGTYMVTSGTAHKEQYFCGRTRLDLLETTLLRLMKESGWNLSMGGVRNHYHLVAYAEEGAKDLRSVLRAVTWRRRPAILTAWT